MRGYINHDLEIKRIKEVAAKHKIDVNAQLLDDPKRVDFLGVDGLTMRKLAETKVIDMFTRIVNYAKPDWAKFRGILKEAVESCNLTYNDGLMANSPIMFIHPKQNDKVVVFTNLVMDEFEGPENPFYWARQRLLKQGETFLKTYFADIKDAKRSQAWATTHRSKKRLLRYEIMDISRAMSRCFPKISASFTAAQIRDISTTIVEYNAPVELKYADNDPTDFYTMYANGPDSCMKDNGSRHFSWMSRLKKKVHPTSIFAYSPYVRGVYMMKGTAVVARTFIYDGQFFGKHKEQKWFYGRLYGSTTKYSSLFRAALEKANIQSMDVGALNMAKEYTITVPAVVVSEEEAKSAGISAGKYMYVPYLDNHSASAYVEFDDDNNTLTVTFSPTTKSGNCSMNNQHGYVHASTFMSNTCHACGGMIHPGGRPIFANDGSVFHDTSCATMAGYVQAIVGANSASIWPRADSEGLIKDIFTGKYYTQSGASAYKILPIITSMKESLEDIELFSGSGDIVEIAGQRYRMTSNVMNSMPGAAFNTLKTCTKHGYNYYLIPDKFLNNKYIDVKSVRAVILPEDHSPVDAAMVRELERLAA